MTAQQPQPSEPAKATRQCEPKRPRRKSGGQPAGLKRAWVRAFIAALRNHGNARLAAEKAGITTSVAYRHRSGCERFRRQWDAALADAVEVLEAVAWRMSTSGMEDWEWKWNPEEKRFVRLDKPPRVEPYMVNKLLQAHKPAKYRPAPQAVELTGADKGPVEIQAAVQSEPDIIIIPAMGSDPKEVEAAILAAEARAAKQGGANGQ